MMGCGVLMSIGLFMMSVHVDTETYWGGMLSVFVLVTLAACQDIMRMDTVCREFDVCIAVQWCGAENTSHIFHSLP